MLDFCPLCGRYGIHETLDDKRLYECPECCMQWHPDTVTRGQVMGAYDRLRSALDRGKSGVALDAADELAQALGFRPLPLFGGKYEELG